MLEQRGYMPEELGCMPEESSFMIEEHDYMTEKPVYMGDLQDLLVKPQPNWVTLVLILKSIQSIIYANI